MGNGLGAQVGATGRWWNVQEMRTSGALQAIENILVIYSVTKYSPKVTYGERVYLASQFEGMVHHVWEALAQVRKAVGHTEPWLGSR